MRSSRCDHVVKSDENYSVVMAFTPGFFWKNCNFFQLFTKWQQKFIVLDSRLNFKRSNVHPPKQENGFEKLNLFAFLIWSVSKTLNLELILNFWRLKWLGNYFLPYFGI